MSAVAMTMKADCVAADDCLNQKWRSGAWSVRDTTENSRRSMDRSMQLSYCGPRTAKTRGGSTPIYRVLRDAPAAARDAARAAAGFDTHAYRAPGASALFLTKSVRATPDH
jgi:hypothetical protein